MYILAPNKFAVLMLLFFRKEEGSTGRKETRSFSVVTCPEASDNHSYLSDFNRSNSDDFG